MNSGTLGVKTVSDTAYWVASYRAMESEREDALFDDPLAALLVGAHGSKVSRSMKPVARHAYWSVTIRTRVIDDYISKYIDQGYKTVINLGAGLDTRPYRLSLPRDFVWIEVDFPEIVALKNEKLLDREPNCVLERVGVDLADPVERERLFKALNDRVGPAIVLTEGVIPYLDESAVSGLANDIMDQPNFDLWIAEYYAPELYRVYQSSRLKNLLGDAPFRFFPDDWFTFFESCGWRKKEMKYLYDEAKLHKRKFPLPWWASILRRFIGEDRMMTKVRTFSAYIVFEKIDS